MFSGQVDVFVKPNGLVRCRLVLVHTLSVCSVLGCHFLVFSLYRINYVVSTGFGLFGVCGHCAEPPEIRKNNFETNLSPKNTLKCLRQNGLLSLVATCIKKPQSYLLEMDSFIPLDVSSVLGVLAYSSHAAAHERSWRTSTDTFCNPFSLSLSLRYLSIWTWFFSENLTWEKCSWSSVLLGLPLNYFLFLKFPLQWQDVEKSALIHYLGLHCPDTD